MEGEGAGVDTVCEDLIGAVCIMPGWNLPEGNLAADDADKIDFLDLHHLHICGQSI